MGLFAVKRVGRCLDGGGFGHYLSLVSPPDWKVVENLELPFGKYDVVNGGSCRDLLFFYDMKGQVLLCNPTSKEMRLLPPPKADNSTPNDITIIMCGCGLVYDAESRDFQVVRQYFRYYFEDEEFGEEEMDLTDRNFSRSETVNEAYSLRGDGEWYAIDHPNSVFSGPGVYLEEAGGSCYWEAVSNDKDIGDHVLSYRPSISKFDSSIELPAIENINIEHKLVEFEGGLGDICHDEESLFDKPIELYHYVNRAWEKKFTISIANVEHPLCLHDDHTLLLRARCGRGRGRILRYNLITGEKKLLPIYDTDRCSMHGYCYRDTTYPLPGSTRMTRLKVSKEMLRKRKRKKTTFEIVQST